MTNKLLRGKWDIYPIFCSSRSDKRIAVREITRGRRFSGIGALSAPLKSRTAQAVRLHAAFSLINGTSQSIFDFANVAPGQQPAIWNGRAVFRKCWRYASGWYGRSGSTCRQFFCSSGRLPMQKGSLSPA